MSARAKNILFLVVVLVIFTIYSLSGGARTVYTEFGADALTLTAPEEFSYTLAYDQVSSLALVELADEGSVVSGGENRFCSWGVRENDAWGRYTLCVVKKADSAILVTTTEGDRLVFSCENDATTESLLPAFQELLAEQAQA